MFCAVYLVNDSNQVLKLMENWTEGFHKLKRFVFIETKRNTVQFYNSNLLLASKENLEKGRFTCYRKEVDSKGEVHTDIFSIYSQYLELIEFYSYVFDKTIDVTESDVVVKMWSSLIERLLRRVAFRTKWGDVMGESADMENRTTGLNRATLYSIHLAANGLYVAVNEGTSVVPNHIAHIKDFREVIMLLFKFKNATTNVIAFGLDGENSNSNNNSAS
ncbi:hypothetical protein G6F62_006447 [Rhizopus arrhizus]|uniref:Uncharacterized protein n=1 Tax=Rhizopus oryzae TaxID=64495 RepID=A0A9P7BTJ8_RHIOR|nr:hypothetical protein G6F23_001138 [Rhizopus arrhizus]KAG0766030.1 hypothetical protein G6F24_003941 [Rhizopus arrhizus]KAG0791109.1 hypothetical protein G6F21_005318 [Rhizopus arrhizus]KAG0812490.1 hypothetical protein G6F20_006315 [Rhizopus arrhizus]KAG0838068.1 hypothetical protein G6F19_003338 [Rhizopus arrhizus]